MSYYIKIIALVHVEVVNCYLVGPFRHLLIFEELALPSKQRPKKRVLNQINSLLSEVDLLEENLPVKVNMVHHFLRDLIHWNLTAVGSQLE